MKSSDSDPHISIVTRYVYCGENIKRVPLRPVYQYKVFN